MKNEIFGLGKIEEVFKVLDIEAKELCRIKDGYSEGYDLTVWEIEEKDEHALDINRNNEQLWKDCGWMPDGGSNIDKDRVHYFTVNGRKMKGYCPDYATRSIFGMKYPFKDVYDYLCQVFSIGADRNVYAVISDLSDLNKLSNSEFLKRYVVCKS